MGLSLTSQADRSQESCESRLEGQRYFIVGLSNGVVAGDLGFDILRYIESSDMVTLFDGPALQFIGENGCMPDDDFDVWGEACGEMEERVAAVARGVGKEDFQIVKASEVCAQDPKEFSRIYHAVIDAIWSDLWVANKIWQIVPPSAKTPSGFDFKAKFSDLSPVDQERAVELIKYEVIHIAFILFSRGEKILHGRSEEKSLQIVNRLKANIVPAWTGTVDKAKGLQAKRLLGHRYPNPYALHSLEEASDVFTAIVERGQVPLRATLRLAEAMRWYVENGQESAMRAYLERNGCEEMLLDFGKTENIYLSAAAITSSVIWRVEKERITADKVGMKVLDVLSDLCLSPDLEVILKDLMPRFCGKWDGSIKFLLENITSAVAGLKNEYERTVMYSLMGILKDLYEISGEDPDEVENSDWFEQALNVDAVFNEGRFEATMGQVGLAGSVEVREEAVDGLLGCKSGIELADEVSSSKMMLMWAGTYADYRNFRLSDASVFYLFKVMLTYLAAKGDGEAFQMLRNAWVEQRTWVVMNWDDILSKYADARAEELGLSCSERVLVACEAADQMGMTANNSSIGLVIEAQRKLAQAVARVKAMEGQDEEGAVQLA